MQRDEKMKYTNLNKQNYRKKWRGWKERHRRKFDEWRAQSKKEWEEIKAKNRKKFEELRIKFEKELSKLDISKVKVPESLQKLVEIYPLLTHLVYYNPFLIDSEGGEYIEKIQKKLVDEIYENLKKSANQEVGARKTRLATEEERLKYEKLTTDFTEKQKIKNRLNIFQWGLPGVKSNRLRKIGGKVGNDVMITWGNIIDPYFPELITIGENSILGMGSCIFTHEIYNGELRVGEVNIGKNVLISFGTIILPGTTIGDNAIVTTGILTTPEVDKKALISGLTGSKQTKYEERKKGKKKQRDVETIPLTLQKDLSKLLWVKGLNPVKFGINNVILGMQRLPFVTPEHRKELLKLIGIKIGKNVTIEDNVVFDIWFPEKITIEDDVIIKRNTAILTHEGLVDRFRIGDVRIGKGTVIESGTGILPGIEIGKNVKILPYSFVTSDVPANSQVKL